MTFHGYLDWYQPNIVVVLELCGDLIICTDDYFAVSPSTECHRVEALFTSSTALQVVFFHEFLQFSVKGQKSQEKNFSSTDIKTLIRDPTVLLASVIWKTCVAFASFEDAAAMF